jgi:hypothetical protein
MGKMTTNETDEIWTKIEGGYEVSNRGQVKSRLGRLLVAGERSGYPYVSVLRDGRLHATAVHRLVAHAFLGFDLDDSRHLINHKDGNKTNAHVDNLEIVTPRQNRLHATRVLGKKTPALCDHLDESTVSWMYFYSEFWDNNYIAQVFGSTPEIVASVIRKQRKIEKEQASMWNDRLFSYGESTP